MTADPIRLLLVEDNPGDARLVQAVLAEHAPGEFAISWVERLADALARVQTDRFDAVLCDLGLPDSMGIATAQAIAAQSPALPLVVLTGSSDADLGREAIRHGAQDYLIKGESDGALIARTLRYAIERKRLEAGIRVANESLERRVAERTAELEAAIGTLRTSESRFRALFENMLNGLAYCRMQYDESGQPVDFVYIEVNQAFERLTGLKDVIGRPVTDVIPGIREANPDLLEFYGRVAATGVPEALEIFVEPLGHWFLISAYGPERGYFVAVFDVITARKRAEQSLRESEGKLRMIFDTALDGILVADAETGKFLTANPAIGRMLGYAPDELLGLSIQDIHRRQDLPRATADFERLRRGEIQLVADVPMMSRDRSVFYADIQTSPMRLGGRNCLLGIFRDVTERRRAAQALVRQKDLYNVLSQTNQTIVRCNDRDELFAAVCRIAVEHGRFRFAWVGLIDPADQQVKLVAKEGDDSGYLGELRMSMDETTVSGRSVTAHALRAGRHGVSNDFLNDPVTAPWHEAARRAGVGAFAVFPIRHRDAVIGAISVYAGEAGFFTEDLLATLDEMAVDVSFALDNFEREAARVRMLQALNESEARYRSLFANSNVIMLLIDPTDGAIVDANAAACTYYGWDLPVLKEMNIRDINTLDPEQVKLELNRIREGHKDRFEFRHRRADGEVRDIEAFSGPVEIGGRKLVLSIIHDIGERVRSRRELAESESRFRGLVEQSIAGTYIIQNGKFAYVNPRFAEIFGYASADEVIGREALSLVAETDRDAVAEAVRRRTEGVSASINYEFAGLCKDGATVDVGVHGARARFGGRPAVIGLIQDISEKKRAEEQILRYMAQLESAFMSTVEVATTLSEMRDPYTAGHERRVAEIAVAIGAELGFDARRQEGLRVAGYLHDIGKITIPSEILAKPGKLSALEYSLIQGHPQASYDVLKPVVFPWPVAQAALQHHERMDGSGYPQGLKGEAILLEARILAVADVVEAMSSHRPYRPGLGIDKALAEIERGRGTAYDAEVADACLRLFGEKGYAVPV